MSFEAAERSQWALSEDIALMLRVRDDDGAAFETLYRAHFGKVQDFFFGMSQDRPLASDLCQETFLRIWKLRKRYTPSGSFLAYLFTFARNVWLEKCRDFTRKKKLREWGEREGADVWGMGDAVLAPDVAAERSEVQSRIQAALQELPDEQRMVVVMRSIKELSLEEVAAALRCPVNTVRSRKLLAFKKLRKTLEGARA